MMRRVWQGSASQLRALLGVCSLALGPGCIPEYHAPTAADPHAIVKIRRSYDTGGGTTLRERLLVDDHSAYSGVVPSALGRSARTDSTLVWPVQANYSFSSDFFHTELKQEYETYYEQVSSMESESYSCGSAGSYQTCTRMVTRYHTEPRQRWVTKTVEVSDGACEASMHFAALADRVYLLQYSYQEARACSLSCFEQVPQSDGTFQNQPCLVALPPSK